MTYGDFINALGGGTAVSDWLATRGIKVDREAVYKWGAQGIPHKYRAALVDMASEKDVAVPANFLPGVRAA